MRTKLTRRDALLALAGASLGCSREPSPSPPPAPKPSASVARSKPAPVPLRGRILGFGNDGTRSVLERAFAKKKTSKDPEKWSVFIDLDLSTGRVKTTPVPINLGHIPVEVGDTRILCVADGGAHSLILDHRTHEVVHVLEGRSGYDYSGHAVVVDGRAYVPLRKTDGKRHEGLLEIVDLKDFKVLETAPTGGYLPHDAKVLPGGKEIVVSHYGHFGDHFASPPHYWNIRETSLSILDAKTLKVKRKLIAPIDQALTHFDIGGDGLIYVGLLQYVRMNERGLAKLIDELGGNERDLPALRPSEYRKQLYGLPSPVLVFDPRKGQLKRLMMAPASQRRNQSVATNRTTGNVFAVFTYSDNVVRIEPRSHRLESISAFDLGLFELRGVCDMPGTPYVAVNGQDRGVAVVDARTLDVVKRFDVALYNTVHLHWVAA